MNDEEWGDIDPMTRADLEQEARDHVFDVPEAFPGQCPAINESGERCAFTDHPRAPEYHSWVRLVQS